jgi:hypothetical protein
MVVAGDYALLRVSETIFFGFRDNLMYLVHVKVPTSAVIVFQ